MRKVWREFPQFPQFPKPENQGFSTVPDYQSLKIVPIFGSMLHFRNLKFIIRIEFRR